MPLRKLSYFGPPKPHVNKVLRSAIMKRSRRRNKANQTLVAVKILDYKRHRS